MHGAPFGEIARQSAPGAASVLQIENGTKDIVQVHLAWRCAFTGTFQQGKERRKLLATDIAWVGFSVHANSFTTEAETINTFLTSLLPAQLFCQKIHKYPDFRADSVVAVIDGMERLGYVEGAAG